MAVSQLAIFFLNGVCRHEHTDQALASDISFLNGVCRHEQSHLTIAIN